MTGGGWSSIISLCSCWGNLKIPSLNDPDFGKYILLNLFFSPSVFQYLLENLFDLLEVKQKCGSFLGL